MSISENDIEFESHYNTLKEVFCSRFTSHLYQMKKIVKHLLKDSTHMKDTSALISLLQEMIETSLNNKYYHLLLTHLCPSLFEFDFQESTLSPQVLFHFFIHPVFHLCLFVK
jgi:hypothetical protein